MHGPNPRPPSYDPVLLPLQNVPLRLDSNIPNDPASIAINEATTQWFKIARGEFSLLSQDDLKFRETKFVTK